MILKYFQPLKKMANCLIGIPDYATYQQHMAQSHPELSPMSQDQFYQLAMNQRFGGKGIKKCPC